MAADLAETEMDPIAFPGGETILASGRANVGWGQVVGKVFTW